MESFPIFYAMHHHFYDIHSSPSLCLNRVLSRRLQRSTNCVVSLLWASVSPIYTLMHSTGYTQIWAFLMSERDMKNSTLKRSGGRYINSTYCYMFAVCSHCCLICPWIFKKEVVESDAIAAYGHCAQTGEPKIYVFICGEKLLVLFSCFSVCSANKLNKIIFGWHSG